MRNSMIDTVVISGGNIQNGFALDFLREIKKERKEKPLRLMAADKGLEFFMESGITPDLAVGDFDSLSDEGKRYLEELENVEILRLRPEKDDSDTQSAVNLAIGRGAKEILLLGVTGSRVDHLMANLGLLVLGRKKGVRIAMADQNNYMTLVDSGTVLKREEQFGKYVSFFPVGGEVEELTLEGFQYPLHRHRLTVSDSGLTVSNEISAAQAQITFSKGTLLMIMSRD